jgi:hypothetical protein
MTGDFQTHKVARVVRVLDPDAVLDRCRRVGFTVEPDEGGSRWCTFVIDATEGTSSIACRFRSARV